jgi:biofilm protein TabA
MIVTDLKNVDHQLAMTPALRKAIEFLCLRGLSDLPDGTTEIDGKKVFAIVQRYETAAADNPRFEFHRKFIDVQFIASGEETIGWTPLERVQITEVYDGGKDVGFGTTGSEPWTPVALKAGELAVLHPEDAHAPRLALGKAGPVLKIVVKVAV